MNQSFGHPRETKTGKWSITRIALGILFVSLVISAVLGIAVIVINKFGDTQIKILATTAVLALMSLVSMPSLLHFDRGTYKLLSGMSILTSSICLALTIAFIWWNDPFENDVYVRMLSTLAIMVFSSNHIFLMLMTISTATFVRVVLNATILVIVMVVMILLYRIWMNPTEDGLLARITGVLLILDVLGSLGVPVLVKISRNITSRTF
jgi:hypothetical protein